MCNDVIAHARALCGVCNAPIKDRPKRCSICGTAYCHNHEFNITLVRKEGTDVTYACNKCIMEHKLQVVDPSHPLYMANK